MRKLISFNFLTVLLLAGCSAGSSRVDLTESGANDSTSQPSPATVPETKSDIQLTSAEVTTEGDSSVQDGTGSPPEKQVIPEIVDSAADAIPQASDEGSTVTPVPEAAETVVAGDKEIVLQDVVGSVYRSYPMLRSALFLRNIATGQQIGASGAFDTKLKGASENGPTAFYETYRHSIGVVQPLMWGGEVFAGYRVGRGTFEPWYLERQTNDGGEFKTGIVVPLARNRNIDERRADLWKANVARLMAEPDIQAQLIGFVQEASYSYWDWISAGENHKIATRILNLAEDRTSRIQAQVAAGLIDPQEEIDNQRLVSLRRAKVADTRRKVQQTAAKLSIYWRDTSGNPTLPREDQSPGFPEADEVDESQFQRDVESALAYRPELRYLDLMRRQIDIDYSEAANQFQPELDAVIAGSQDVGQPTSSKRDKSQLEAEASIYLDVPLQRRKARGKMAELEAKVSQVMAKRRLTQDKIVVDVQVAYAGLISSWEQVQLTKDAVDKAEELADRERQLLDEGASDMLKVTLREQYAVESAEKAVDALRLYFDSLADYRAAIAIDRVQ